MGLLWIIQLKSNNLDESQVTGINEDSYLEYENFKEFYDWILSLKPKDVRDKGISQQALYKNKTNVRSGKLLNPKGRIERILLGMYKETRTDLDN